MSETLLERVKKLYDFYTREGNVHFTREEMTESEAKKYAKRFELTFEEAK